MFNMASRPTLRRGVEYGEWTDDYIPTVGTALESSDSELESADSNIDSSSELPKISVWVWAFTLEMLVMVTIQCYI